MANVEVVPWTELLAALALIVMVAVAIEVAEAGSRLASAGLRYGDRLAPAPPKRFDRIERFAGVIFAASVIWWYALPWAMQTTIPQAALLLFLGIFAVGVALLGRIRSAAVRYPAATTAPFLVVAAVAVIA